MAWTGAGWRARQYCNWLDFEFAIVEIAIRFDQVAVDVCGMLIYKADIPRRLVIETATSPCESKIDKNFAAASNNRFRVERRLHLLPAH